MAALALNAARLSAAEVRGRVVDSEGAGVADAVVFVQEAPPGPQPAAVNHTAIMDQVHKQFVPHLLPVIVGTEVSFPNHDQIHHHVYSFSRPKAFEIPLYKGETTPPVLFDTVGAVKVGCNIHDWMSAVIVVLPTPYYTITDAAGAFVLRDVPAGPSTLAAWHEGSKVKVEETFRAIELGPDVQDITFTLPIAPPRPRPASRGMRSYE